MEALIIPDWTAPFHMPRFEEAKYIEAREAYVKENGYRVSLPGYDDIIHLQAHAPLTSHEKTAIKNNNYDGISPARKEEIQQMYLNKMRRIEQMRSSPSPTIVRNIGAIMTSIDDAQDALTTISVIGRLAIHTLPRIGFRLIPYVGWVMTAADCLNLAMMVGRMGLVGRSPKRTYEKFTQANPFGKKAKLKRAVKLSKPFPSFGNLVEMAQTTDQIFGVGVCLGPIVGAVQDAIAGGIRTLMGQKVSWGAPPPIELPTPHKAAAKAVKAHAILQGSGFEPEEGERIQLAASQYLSYQYLNTVSKDWNILDKHEHPERLEIQAPMISDPITQKALYDSGALKENYGGWPHNGNEWANTTDLVNQYMKPGNEHLKKSMAFYEHDVKGHIMGNLMSDTAFYSMTTFEGDDSTTYEYTEQIREPYSMLEMGLHPSPNMTTAAINKLADYLDYNEANGVKPSALDIKAFCKSSGIPLEQNTTTPDADSAIETYNQAGARDRVIAKTKTINLTAKEVLQHAQKLFTHRIYGMPGVSSDMRVNALCNELCINSGHPDLVRGLDYIQKHL